jgi:hypothetical protein
VEVAFIKVQPARDHITRKKNVLQSIVIKIPDADPAAIINVYDVEGVDGIIFRDPVIKGNPGPGGGNVFK